MGMSRAATCWWRARGCGSAQMLGTECETGREPASELVAAGHQVEWPTLLFLDQFFFPSLTYMFAFWNRVFFFLALRRPSNNFISK